MKLIKRTNISIIILILVSVFNGYVHGQSAHYVCYKKSVCGNDPIRIKKYSLLNSDTTFVSNDSGVCNVTILGTYTLYSTEIITDFESPEIKIAVFGNIEDTLQSWALYPILVVGLNSSERLKDGDWVYCGNRCEGYTVDYYYNGNKRVEGNFKKGKPFGELKFYSEAGQIKYIEYYNKRGKKTG